MLKICPAILFCFCITTGAFSQTNGSDRLTARTILQKSREAYAALSSYSDTGTSTVIKHGQTNFTTFSLKMQRTNSFILEWIQTRADQTNQGRWWYGHSPFGIALLTNIVGQATNDRPTYGMNGFEVREQTGEATRVMDLFFESGPFKLSLFAFMNAKETNSVSDKYVVTDGKVGDVDCYVLSLTTPELKHPPYPLPQSRLDTRTWIGKKDFLVHQMEYISGPPSETTLTQIHENIIVNQKIPDEDFEVKIPEEEQTSSITLSSPPPATNSGLSQTNDTVQKQKRRKARRNYAQ